AHRRLEPGADGRVPLGLLADRPPQRVGRAAAADRDPAVRRPLRVEEEVPPVADRQPLTPSQLVPDRRRQRLGRDHQAVQREEPEPLARELRRVRLGRRRTWSAWTRPFRPRTPPGPGPRASVRPWTPAPAFPPAAAS